MITCPTPLPAKDRILLGRREGSNVLLPEEKKHAVAIHGPGMQSRRPCPSTPTRWLR